MMKYSLLGLSVLAFTIAGQPAMAETRIETVLGTVTSVSPLTSNIVRETPQTQRVCSDENVPIYSQDDGSSDLGSMIVGGLIGAAVGNKLTDNDGGGAAGTVAGALLGREHAKANRKSKIVGYNQRTVCSDKQILVSETVERVTGYRLSIEADGRILQIDSSKNRDVGDRIELRKQVSYSMR